MDLSRNGSEHWCEVSVCVSSSVPFGCSDFAGEFGV